MGNNKLKRFLAGTTAFLIAAFASAADISFLGVQGNSMVTVNAETSDGTTGETENTGETEVPEDPNVITGECGEGTAYSYDKINKTLTVSAVSENAKISAYAFNAASNSDENRKKIGQETGTLVIGDGVTIIGEYAFSECTKLKSVKIADTVTTIGKAAFRKSKIENITVPNTVTEIGDEAFYYCTSLKKVTLSNALKQINSCTFEGCSGLESVTIPESVQYVGRYAFLNCGNLKNLIIKSSEKKINFDASAFNFPGNTTVFYTGTKEQWNNNVTGLSKLKFKEIVCNYRYVKATSLILDGTIKMKIYFNDEIVDSVDNEDTENTGNTNISDKGNCGWTIGDEPFVTENNSSDNTNYVIISVAPKDYENKFQIKRNGSVVKEVSVSDIIDKYLSNPEYFSKVQDLIKSLQVYCKSAKQYFGKETVDAVDTEDIEIGDFSASVEKYDGNTGIVYKGSSLVLESGTVLRHYFVYDKGAAPVTVPEGFTLNKKENSDFWYFEKKDIAAHNLNEAYLLDIPSRLTITGYSPLQYCYKIISDTELNDDNLKSLCKALCRYSKEAERYWDLYNK